MNFIDFVLYPFAFEVSSLNLGIYRFLFFSFFFAWQIKNFADLKLILKSIDDGKPYNKYNLYFSILSSALCALGLLGNLSILLFLFLFSSIIKKINYFIGTTGDVVFRAILLFLLFSPCSFSFSLDSLIFTGHFINEKITMVPGASVLSIQYMLILMYAYASFVKIDDPHWVSGEIMHLATSSPLYGKNNFFSKLFEKKIIQIYGSRITIYYQYFAIVFLQFQDTKIVYALLGIILHLSMAASMKLGYFPHVMVLGLLSFLI